MMVSPDGQFCFVSTMKCATNSMYKLLGDIGWRSLIRSAGGFHARPKNRLARIHFTIVRNPYDRAVSIWASTCLREGDRYGAKAWIISGGGEPDSFEDFCSLCLTRSPHTWAGVPWLFRNQSDWIDTFVCDRVLYMESLDEELSALIGHYSSLPVENASEHNDWIKYMNGNVIDIINRWAAGDFRYEYEKLQVQDGVKESWNG